MVLKLKDETGSNATCVTYKLAGYCMPINRSRIRRRRRRKFARKSSKSGTRQLKRSGTTHGWLVSQQEIYIYIYAFTMLE